jgi:hypothetical protein
MTRKSSKKGGEVVSLDDARRAAPSSSHCVGCIVGWSESTRGLLVDYPGNPGGPVEALSTIQISEEEARAHTSARQPVLLCFDDARPHVPIVLGLIRDAVTPEPPSAPKTSRNALVLQHDERVEIRCGKSTLILTKDGKAILRAAYVSSQSAGVYRIRAGSVDIN